MPDQEVHEIQLNGKQLVFMFMAATVVSVVIFLCGVMVGRGVRQPQSDPLANAETVVEPAAALEATSPEPVLPVDPPPVPDTLTYAEHLEAPVAPDEPLKPAERKPTVAPAVAEKPAVTKAVATEAKQAEPPPAPQKALVSRPEPAATTVSADFKEPRGNGWVAQVMVFPAVADAEALVRRLRGKGYTNTFVSLNETGPATARYRVRVGKYPTKDEAVVVGKKLQREEKFVPWVTR